MGIIWSSELTVCTVFIFCILHMLEHIYSHIESFLSITDSHVTFMSTVSLCSASTGLPSSEMSKWKKDKIVHLTKWTNNSSSVSQSTLMGHWLEVIHCCSSFLQYVVKFGSSFSTSFLCLSLPLFRLAGYVEALASRLGMQIPDLSPKQADMWQTRVSSHSVGIVRA